MKIYSRILGIFCAALFLETLFSFTDARLRIWKGIGLITWFWILFVGILIISAAVLIAIRHKEFRDVKKIIKNRDFPKQELTERYFDSIAGNDHVWKKQHGYYHDQILRLTEFLVPEQASVAEIGCGAGHLIGRLPRKKRAGIDISRKMIKAAVEKYPDIRFEIMAAEAVDSCRLKGPYDYILMSDLISHVQDVQKVFEQSKILMHGDSRLITTSFSYLWEPLLQLSEKLHWKIPQPRQNWLSMTDIRNLLELAGFDVIKKGTALMFPLNIPILSFLMNRILVRLPLFHHFGLIQFLVAKKVEKEPQAYSVSVIIPARNEAGNIETAVLDTPEMGTFTELIFVEGHSTDGTWEEIKRVAKKYQQTHRIRYLQQPGIGKGDAVRAGFMEASGDVVTILDSDLTVPPKDLVKFYNMLANRQADFINGSRLVYPMEKKAMRFLNVLGNKFFSMAFSWLLDQPIKDTLCGTKMLLKKDYDRITANRAYFGDFDPFGDFDLLFGASKLNLKIKEVPIRYQARTYGTTNIQRWKHGLLLFRMVLFAMRKIKFI